MKKAILERAGFTVSNNHDPIGIYKTDIHSKKSRYTITLGHNTYENMIVGISEYTEEQAIKSLLRQFFTLYTQEREEHEKLKKKYQTQNIDNARMRELAKRILCPTTLDEPENF